MSPYQLCFPVVPAGLSGDEQARTVDPLLAKQVLSQLSYTPIYRRGSFRSSIPLGLSTS